MTTTEPIRKYAEGMDMRRTKAAWRNMKQRVKKDHRAHSRYFDRGIRVCERWLVWENFLGDMGVCPKNRSIDRINNDAGYEPGNCRWATKRQQSLNRTNTVWVEHGGKKKKLHPLLNRNGISRGLYENRTRKGKNLTQTLDMPIRPSKSYKESKLRIVVPEGTKGDGKNIGAILRKEIRKANRPIRAISIGAKVEYLTLWRWVKGINASLDLDVSEKVYKHLTGKGFTGR